MNEIIEYKKEQLNFDVYDRYKQFIPSYQGTLYNPSYGQYYY